ncbi:MAG TPA: alkaline phosphatase [Thermoanaerobaculia bacterium]|nr:alkaline phosphatase [Thermoanaerobaculia bacterium]
MLFFVAFLATSAVAGERPKNIILLVGDGMGAGHVTAARWIRGDKLQLLRMPVTAVMTTHCADEAVTDSAAAASAFATGMKTNYRALSVDAEGQPRRTVLEAAHAAGMATGLVTTTNFWDATPAAFASHAKQRYTEAPSIARQIANSAADIVVGGGIDDLGKDQLPTLDELKESGRAVVTSLADLQASKAPRILGVMKTQQNDAEDPAAPLAVLAKWAIERLSADPDGFFLMIENEGIDSSSHNNASRDVAKALQQYDDAVGVALDFAAARGDTLVIAVGDHETGGMRIFQGRDLKKWRMEWSTVEHSGNVIPLFAFGPGSESLAGTIDNTDVGRKLLAFVTK